MLYRVGADFVAAIHVLSIVFIVFGGFLFWRWRRIVYIHAPLALWGTLIWFTGWICPLTPLENSLRNRGGGIVYEGGFVEHYIVPLFYGSTFTSSLQAVVGVIVVLVNAVAYGFALRRSA